MFITFEGGEGVGKSTNIMAAKQWLEQQGHQVIVTREPGGTPIAEKIRDDLLKAQHSEPMNVMTELLLVFAARAQHWQRVIKPALDDGKWVLCDRFNDSTVAYQGYGRGIDLQKIDDLRHMTLGDKHPDLTIFLDAPVHLGMARASARDKQQGIASDRFEIEKKAFFERVRQGFTELSEQFSRIKKIDASRALETVTADVITKISDCAVSD